MTINKIDFFPKIKNLVDWLNFESITEERKKTLQPLINYIQRKKQIENEIRLNFICTHNSRRSHFSQVWAQTAAAFYDIKNIFCYSGGTEATAFFLMAYKILEKQGFHFKTIAEGFNPIYSIKYSENSHPIIGFSKKFDDDFNPKNEFAAILTCSSADQGCPFITGAEVRISITFDDPKVFDNTLQQVEKYEERSIQIATEMFYVFSKIKS